MNFERSKNHALVSFDHYHTVRRNPHTLGTSKVDDSIKLEMQKRALIKEKARRCSYPLRRA